jgi:hypothetical protein
MTRWGRREFDIEDSFEGWRFWAKVAAAVGAALAGVLAGDLIGW